MTKLSAAVHRVEAFSSLSFRLKHSSTKHVCPRRLCSTLRKIKRVAERSSQAAVYQVSNSTGAEKMSGIIYLVGLIVVVMFILSVLGLA
ncbi:hypothetical protein [Martelella limonii]|uniref:hypothetical protein n=1 Tax=Martelella limonii TaxID=1647649 RepID=UPI0015803F8F|nr:hypothetical protein [Martelella limonii]